MQIIGNLFLKAVFLLTFFLSSQSFAAKPFTKMGCEDIFHNFQSLIDEGKYQEAAADCLADDVYFASPKFAYKSKEEWLKKFPTFHQKTVQGDDSGPQFGPLEQVGDKTFVRHGKAKVFGFSISVKETIEINDEGKIARSVMQKA